MKQWSARQENASGRRRGLNPNRQAEGRPPEPNKTNKGATMVDSKQGSRGQATPPPRNEFQPSKPRLYSNKKGNTRYGRNKIEKSYLKSCQRQHQANVIRISSPRAKLTRGVICSAKNVKFILLGTNSQSAGGKWGHQVETQAGFDAYLRPCGEGPPLVPASWNSI